MITRELVIVPQALRSTADDCGNSVDKLGIVFFKSGPAPVLEEATRDVESAGHLTISLDCETIALSPMRHYSLQVGGFFPLQIAKLK